MVLTEFKIGLNQGRNGFIWAKPNPDLKRERVYMSIFNAEPGANDCNIPEWSPNGL